MKRIPIDECPAGPALDAAAGKALGWTEYEIDGLRFWQAPAQEEQPGEWESTGYFIYPTHSDLHFELPAHLRLYGGKGTWRPSKDIAAAWELVEDLYKQAGEWISTTRSHKGNYCAGVIGTVSDWDWWEYSSEADTAPLAITRAYLKAKGVEFVEVPDDKSA
jgi:hypothetical protein